MDVTGRVLDLAEVAAAMQSAGVPAALGLSGPSQANPAVDLHTFDAGGEAAELSPAQQTVVMNYAPSTALHDALVSALTSSVGVALGSLTQAQRLALVAGLLFKAGAIDKQTLVVRPLAAWLFT